MQELRTPKLAKQRKTVLQQKDIGNNVTRVTPTRAVAMRQHHGNGATAMLMPSRSDLEIVFRMKYGDPGDAGWRPALSYKAGYFTPDDYYETLVSKLVQEGDPWLDVGSGRDLFPQNPRLSAVLSQRSGLVVGVDPDENLDENPYVHERAKVQIEDFSTPRTFPLVTLRMVAEHITRPDAALEALARLTARRGKVVVYTVNQWSPAALAAWAVPFQFHHRIKRFLWNCEERDTFPVAYRLNTRKALTDRFEAAGFRELCFAYLDDCRTFARFRWLHRVELALWGVCKGLGLTYPENCLLGVFERA